MKVWRIHLKNDIAEEYTMEDLLNFCIDNKLIGVGWSDIKTREDSELAIKKEALVYPDATAVMKAVNSMRKIKEDDLIWARIDNIYYLCRVTGLWKDSTPGEMHDQLEVSNYVSAEWLKIGMEELVPEKAVSSFRTAAVIQSISDIEDISKHIWNKHSKIVYYKKPEKKSDIWSVLPSECVEEIVLLYLQMEKGFHIYSTTMKYSAWKYECTMINREGILAYPQVKNGTVVVRAESYMDAVELEPTAQVYLFSTGEKYIKNQCDNIHFIYKRELEEFIKDNRRLLPGLTESWIAMTGFFE